MQEMEAAEKARAGSAPEVDEAEKIRVTDRRRIKLDESGASSSSANEDAPNLKPSYVEELESRTRAAEQKTLDVQARFEQLRAELRRETDDTKQRLQRAAEERAGREKATFVAALLPTLDNLQRAMEAAESGGSLAALLDGLRSTIAGFESALISAGAEAVASVGAPFDPELHEAVDILEVEAARDNLVTAEYSRGYKMGGQLLRPARVQVGRAQTIAQGATE